MQRLTKIRHEADGTVVLEAENDWALRTAPAWKELAAKCAAALATDIDAKVTEIILASYKDEHVAES